MRNQTLVVGVTVWSLLLPAAALSQTPEELRDYARQVYAAEQGAGHLNPVPRDYVGTGASMGSWARALSRVDAPKGYGRLHGTLVRNARLAATAANQLRVAPSAGIDACNGRTANASESCESANIIVPEGAQQRLSSALHQYFAARNRLEARLKAAGVTLQGWPGNVIIPPASS